MEQGAWNKFELNQAKQPRTGWIETMYLPDYVTNIK